MRGTALATCAAALFGLADCSSGANGGSDAAAGTGSDGGTGESGAGTGVDTYVCDQSGTLQICTLYSWKGIPPNHREMVRAQYAAACTEAGGTTPASCATSNLLGVCTFTVTSGAAYSYQVFYYVSQGRTPQSAMSDCAAANDPGGGITTSWSVGG